MNRSYRKTTSLILVELLNVLQNTHIYLLPAALNTSEMSRVDNGFLFCLSLNTRCQNFKVGPVSPDCRIRADCLKRAARQM